MIVTSISATTSIPTAGAVKTYVDNAVSAVSSSFNNPLKLIIRLFCQNTSGMYIQASTSYSSVSQGTITFTREAQGRYVLSNISSAAGTIVHAQYCVAQTSINGYTPRFCVTRFNGTDCFIYLYSITNGGLVDFNASGDYIDIFVYKP